MRSFSDSVIGSGKHPGQRESDQQATHSGREVRAVFHRATTADASHGPGAGIHLFGVICTKSLN